MDEIDSCKGFKSAGSICRLPSLSFGGFFAFVVMRMNFRCAVNARNNAEALLSQPNSLKKDRLGPLQGPMSRRQSFLPEPSEPGECRHERKVLGGPPAQPLVLPLHHSNSRTSSTAQRGKYQTLRQIRATPPVKALVVLELSLKQELEAELL